jgi:hypothetical protein
MSKQPSGKSYSQELPARVEHVGGIKANWLLFVQISLARITLACCHVAKHKHWKVGFVACD